MKMEDLEKMVFKEGIPVAKLSRKDVNFLITEILRKSSKNGPFSLVPAISKSTELPLYCFPIGTRLQLLSLIEFHIKSSITERNVRNVKCCHLSLYHLLYWTVLESFGRSNSLKILSSGKLGSLLLWHSRDIIGSGGGVGGSNDWIMVKLVEKQMSILAGLNFVSNDNILSQYMDWFSSDRFALIDSKTKAVLAVISFNLIAGSPINTEMGKPLISVLLGYILPVWFCEDNFDPIPSITSIFKKVDEIEPELHRCILRYFHGISGIVNMGCWKEWSLFCSLFFDEQNSKDTLLSMDFVATTFLLPLLETIASFPDLHRMGFAFVSSFSVGARRYPSFLDAMVRLVKDSLKIQLPMRLFFLQCLPYLPTLRSSVLFELFGDSAACIRCGAAEALADLYARKVNNELHVRGLFQPLILHLTKEFNALFRGSPYAVTLKTWKHRETMGLFVEHLTFRQLMLPGTIVNYDHLKSLQQIFQKLSVFFELEELEKPDSQISKKWVIEHTIIHCIFGMYRGGLYLYPSLWPLFMDKITAYRKHEFWFIRFSVIECANTLLEQQLKSMSNSRFVQKDFWHRIRDLLSLIVDDSDDDNCPPETNNKRIQALLVSALNKWKLFWKDEIEEKIEHSFRPIEIPDEMNVELKKQDLDDYLPTIIRYSPVSKKSKPYPHPSHSHEHSHEHSMKGRLVPAKGDIGTTQANPIGSLAKETALQAVSKRLQANRESWHPMLIKVFKLDPMLYVNIIGIPPHVLAGSADDCNRYLVQEKEMEMIKMENLCNTLKTLESRVKKPLSLAQALLAIKDQCFLTDRFKHLDCSELWNDDCGVSVSVADDQDGGSNRNSVIRELLSRLDLHDSQIDETPNPNNNILGNATTWQLLEML